jgi:alkyl sulfatase BDS1-like metallo-beta-lactamase superfamily hydrolase
MPSGASPKSNGPDMIKAMTTELWLNSLAIAMDSKKAAGMKFLINLSTPDNGEQFVVEMSNSTLTNIKGQQAKNPNLTIVINRSDLEKVMGGQATFEKLLAEGKATFTGDRKVFDQLKSTLTIFTPDFELMPGTKQKKAPVIKAKDPFEVQELAITAGD